MSENRAFTDRCISRLQRIGIHDGLFAVACTGYLIRHGRIAYDAERDLFWTSPTSGPPQVAVWMMPLVMEGDHGEQA